MGGRLSKVKKPSQTGDSGRQLPLARRYSLALQPGAEDVVLGAVETAVEVEVGLNVVEVVGTAVVVTLVVAVVVEVVVVPVVVVVLLLLLLEVSSGSPTGQASREPQQQTASPPAAGGRS